MQLQLHHPLDGYYQGTRFDRGGVFKSLVFGGVELCGEWFEQYSPTMHDAVCGPAEEFSMIPCGDHWIKAGVGLLAPDGEPYDRFKLYDIEDAGRWQVEQGESQSIFIHTLEPFYTYRKEIRTLSPNAFEISHELRPQIPWEGEVYNHNFFTLGRLETGAGRTIDFPFQPEGTWRARYDSVAFAGNSIRFSRTLQKGESVFCGNIHQAGCEGMPYDLTLGEGPLKIHITGNVPASRTVFWAYHRIACPEPYNSLKASSGETLRWSIRYEINIAQ